MPTMADFIRDYHSDDREDVLKRMQAGEDVGQSDYQPQQINQASGSGMSAPQGLEGFQSGGQQQQQQQAPQWDRTAFRDAWMGSGVRNVPDMQNWLKQTGWGQHVRTAGSKGDVMQLPTGENIDAVLAAGLGGNRGGPQWTGRGSWMGGDSGGGSTGYASPSMGQMNNMFGSGMGGGMTGGNMQQPQQSFTGNRMYNRPQPMRSRVNASTGQRFQSRGFGQPQQQQMSY